MVRLPKDQLRVQPMRHGQAYEPRHLGDRVRDRKDATRVDQRLEAVLGSHKGGVARGLQSEVVVGRTPPDHLLR